MEAASAVELAGGEKFIKFKEVLNGPEKVFN
jgi:hypothetical protein